MSGLSGRQKAEENVKALLEWIAQRDAVGDYADYENDGKINRKALCAELDFARSVVSQNPAVKSLLQETENRWFGTEHDKDTDSLKAASERTTRKSDMTTAENARLLDELGKLKAENALLKSQLRRYAAMEDVLISSGIAPR